MRSRFPAANPAPSVAARAAVCLSLAAALPIAAQARPDTAPDNSIRSVPEKARAIATRDAPHRDAVGLLFLPPAPEELATGNFRGSALGPAAPSPDTAHANDIERATACCTCDVDAPAARESPLPASWTEFADAFASRPDSIAGNWLRDQGCFTIIGCFGATNAAYGLTLPASFDYTAQLPSFKVCGTCGNFAAPNDLTIPMSAVPPGGPEISTPVTPNACSANAASVASQRDQDYILVNIPPGGIDNFRLYVTGAQNFEAGLLCNKNFPNPGTINGCWTGSQPVPAEFGYTPVVRNNPAITSLPDGAKDSTWVWPRDAPWENIPEGQYIITYRLQPFASLNPPSVPTEPTRPYQIRVEGRFAACPCTTNLVDNPPADLCRVTTADLAVFLSRFGRSCTGLDPQAPPGAPPRCPGGYIDGDFNLDGAVNTADLTILLIQFGKQNADGACE